MNITEIKEKLGLRGLELNTATNADGTPAITINETTGVQTKWFRHWDNEKRLSVSIAEDLMLKVIADKNTASLALQHAVREAAGGNYDSYRIVQYTPAEYSL